MLRSFGPCPFVPDNTPFLRYQIKKIIDARIMYLHSYPNNNSRICQGSFTDARIVTYLGDVCLNEELLSLMQRTEMPS